MLLFCMGRTFFLQFGCFFCRLYITLDLFYVRLEKQNLYNERIDSDAIHVHTSITIDIVSYTIKSSAIKK